MRTLMLKRFEALVRRSAFVVGIVLDEEENKTEIMLDPVRASRSHPHTQNPFHTSGAQRWRRRTRCSHFICFLFFFVFVSVVQGSESRWAGVGVRHTEVEAAGTAACLFHAGELSAVLMGMQRDIISALRG